MLHYPRTLFVDEHASFERRVTYGKVKGKDDRPFSKRSPAL